MVPCNKFSCYVKLWRMPGRLGTRLPLSSWRSCILVSWTLCWSRLNTEHRESPFMSPELAISEISCGSSGLFSLTIERRWSWYFWSKRDGLAQVGIHCSVVCTSSGETLDTTVRGAKSNWFSKAIKLATTWPTTCNIHTYIHTYIYWHPTLGAWLQLLPT